MRICSPLETHATAWLCPRLRGLNEEHERSLELGTSRREPGAGRRGEHALACHVTYVSVRSAWTRAELMDRQAGFESGRRGKRTPFWNGARLSPREGS